MGKAKELTSTERTINIIIIAALLIYGIINAVMVINAYSKLSGNVTILGDIVTNWQANSVTDLQVVTTTSCPTGYEAAMNDRYWPGVDDGCYCGSLVSETAKTDKNITCSPFCSSSCSFDATSIGCTNVAGKSKTLLNYFGVVGVNPAQICIKRSTESWAQVGSVSAATCPDGYTACGDASSPENMYCTKLSACPISEILVESNSNCLLTGQVCYQVDTNSWVKYRRGTNSLPLAEFRLNEYGMCDIKSEDNVTPNRKSFSLLDKKPSTCFDEGADKWTYTATIKEDKLFAANGLTSYISGLTAYPDTANNMNGYYEGTATGANYNWKMATRSYIPWKLDCRDDMNSFIEKKSFVDKSKSAQLALLVIGLISTFFLSIVLAIMEIQNLRGVDLSCIDGKGEEERTKLKRFKKWVNYGFKFLQIPFQIWAILLAAGSKTLLTSVAADECSSTEINANIAFLATNLTATHKSNIIALVVLLATLVLDVVLAAWESRKKKTETTAVSPTSQPVQEMNQSSARPLAFDQSSPGSPVRPQQNFNQPQPQPQQTVTIQLQQQPQQPAPMQFGQPQQPAPIQYGQPQQPAPMQFGQQQYPQQQPAPMQFGQQPMQFAPQQYPQQQQQYPRY